MVTLSTDVLVIGGGATGAGVAWDAALRLRRRARRPRRSGAAQVVLSKAGAQAGSDGSRRTHAASMWRASRTTRRPPSQASPARAAARLARPLPELHDLRDRGVFAARTVSGLPEWSDFALEDRGSLIEPMVYAASGRYARVSWADAFELVGYPVRRRIRC